ncbi:MAG TPA: DNA mismatch repair protein MutS [Chlorobiota bacterium]|nr:DNA mismatch repair protein MutS [Chlorobiota bacterium]
MREKETPLMRQYRQIKEKHPDTILLFRLGDFYETFGDDAVVTAKACGITLTKRNNGGSSETPLAGFPHHQLDSYLPKLVRAGHRVAVCEQLEDPKQAKGIVRRDVVEVVTPGVVLYDKLLESQRNTFVAALTSKGGLAICDVSTGTFSAGVIPPHRLPALLESMQPAEILVDKDNKEFWEPILDQLTERPAVTRLEHWMFDDEFTSAELLRHFKTSNLKGFGFESHSDAVVAAGVILTYVSQTQKSIMAQISSLRRLDVDDTMILDTATRRNLEIHSSMSGDNRAGALVGILDHTKTSMGARLLRWWLQAPLVDVEALAWRLSAVRTFVDDSDLRTSVRGILARIGDLERLVTKVVTRRANPRDLVALRSSLHRLPEVLRACNKSSSVVQELSSSLPTFDALRSDLDAAFVDEPALQVGSGGIFQRGFHPELDTYMSARTDGKSWISEYQDQERSRTGIGTLKVGYTNVFGYYIEVSRTQSAKVPEDYERRQTLANAERYTTPRLREIESMLSAAEDGLARLESQLLDEMRETIANDAVEIQRAANIVATIDVLAAFADVASEHAYVEPVLHDGHELRIEGARHPVIEQILPPGTSYVANDVMMDGEAPTIHIITGPNMSGKSSYLRQTGLIVFLAHVGCFVPARSAFIPRTDRIFTRVGAQDNITAGESTFLVEMQESANILNNATRRSLVLLDEVGRGTATFDGISIAWAIAEYLHEVIGCKTLFATHYHELTALAGQFARISNFRVDVREVADTIVFTHRVVPGHTDHSFGIHVARMAGLPASVITTATHVLEQLESGGHEPVRISRELDPGQMSLFEFRDDTFREKVRRLDVDNMTPVQALRVLAELKDTLHE